MQFRKRIKTNQYLKMTCLTPRQPGWRGPGADRHWPRLKGASSLGKDFTAKRAKACRTHNTWMLPRAHADGVISDQSGTGHALRERKGTETWVHRSSSETQFRRPS